MIGSYSLVWSLRLVGFNEQWDWARIDFRFPHIFSQLMIFSLLPRSLIPEIWYDFSLKTNAETTVISQVCI
jgi:hypothetical protein